MSIQVGSIVSFKGELYYLDRFDSLPHIYNPDKGGFYTELSNITLVEPGNSDMKKLMNFVFVHSKKRKNESETLDYIAKEFRGMPKYITDIYRVFSGMKPASLPIFPAFRNRTSSRSMHRENNFDVNDTVYVGTRRFRVVAINDDTYTLSPNVSGGAGGVNVDAPKEHVTKGPNHTTEGEGWLRSLDGEDLEPEELVKDLSEAKCTISKKVKDIFKEHSTMDTRVTFDQDEVADFARIMFGYDRGIFDSYSDFTTREAKLLNHPNREYNLEFFKFRSGNPVNKGNRDFQDAMVMNEIFKKVKETGMFETQRHGIVYRSFAKDVASAKTVCGTLNRFTSTTLIKNYADKWGTDIDPITGKQNEEGFFSTIIIPAGTRSIIPLLVFPELGSKRRQYEVLLSPDGILKDTGFVDSGGSKILIYLEREYCGIDMRAILTTEMRGTNILGFIQCVFDDVTFQGRTGGKRKTRRKSRKYKSKRV